MSVFPHRDQIAELFIVINCRYFHFFNRNMLFKGTIEFSCAESAVKLQSVSHIFCFFFVGDMKSMWELYSSGLPYCSALKCELFC